MQLTAVAVAVIRSITNHGYKKSYNMNMCNLFMESYSPFRTFLKAYIPTKNRVFVFWLFKERPTFLLEGGEEGEGEVSRDWSSNWATLSRKTDMEGQPSIVAPVFSYVATFC